jgi:hypothetical protein
MASSTVPVSMVELDRYLPVAPFMTSAETARVLGFKTLGALSRACVAGRLPITMFQVPGRRGYWASTDELRRWFEQTLARHIKEKPP